MADPMNRGAGVKETHTGRDVREYSSISEDVNLLTDGPINGVPCRMLVVLAASASDQLHLVTDAGETRVLSADLWVGTPLMCAARTINGDTSSGVTVAVIW